MSKQWTGIAAACAAVLAVPTAAGYPLDAYEETGIARLEAYRLAASGPTRGSFPPPGALLRSYSLRLRLADRQDFAIPPPDAALSGRLRELLGPDAGDYSVSLLDLSDPNRPAFAAHQPDQLQNPGSVGKIMVALGWFQALADTYPDDIEARRRLMRETVVTANGFIRTDTHDVPFWEPGAPRVLREPLEEGDRANLYTYLDWMCSASSNAAASMVLSQALLLKHFGRDYPVSEERAAAFFRDTPKSELSKLLADVLQGSARRSGIDLGGLRQGSFFTREGKKRVPGTSSHSSSRELLHYLVRMEKGQLVDPFSSLEIKRLLYLTDARIRYASSPALRSEALIFKSGSLYSCRPEPGFTCQKYMGNRLNYMNSATSIETIDRKPQLHYVVVVLSNVLRKNSAVEHQTLATRIHRLVESRHPEKGATTTSRR